MATVRHTTTASTILGSDLDHNHTNLAMGAISNTDTSTTMIELMANNNHAVMTNDGQDDFVDALVVDTIDSDAVDVAATTPHRPLVRDTAAIMKPVLTRRRSKSSINNNNSSSSSYDQNSRKLLLRQRQLQRREQQRLGVRFGEPSMVEYESCTSFCPREDLWYTAEEYQGFKSSIRKALTMMSLRPSRFNNSYEEKEEDDSDEEERICYRGIESRRERVHQRRSFLRDFVHIHTVMNIRDPEVLGLICVQKTCESIRYAHELGRMDAFYAQRVYRAEETMGKENEEDENNKNNFFCEGEGGSSSFKSETTGLISWSSPSSTLSCKMRRRLLVDRMTIATIPLPPVYNPQRRCYDEETGEYDGYHHSEEDDYCQDDDCWWILTSGLWGFDLNPSKVLACTDLEQDSTKASITDSVSKSAATDVTTATNMMEPYNMMIARNSNNKNVDEVLLSLPAATSLPLVSAPSLFMGLIFQCLLSDSSS